MKLNYPAEFVNTKGYFGTESNGEVAKGINLMAFYYVAMPEEEYDELFQKEDITQEELNLCRSKTGVLLNVITINKGRSSHEHIIAAC